MPLFLVTPPLGFEASVRCLIHTWYVTCRDGEVRLVRVQPTANVMVKGSKQLKYPSMPSPLILLVSISDQVETIFAKVTLYLLDSNISLLHD